ncbi:MAG: chorismate mutase [Oscillospiraceae bacterium]|nr:chorismate mutase [Oscillospiraceae bacterium]
MNPLESTLRLALSMNLETIRCETDKIDDEIAVLFERRLKLVESVAQVKKETNTSILKPTREREIVGRLTHGREGVMADYFKLLFTTIFDISRSHQIVLTNRSSKTADAIVQALETTPQLFPKNAEVACQGTEGANSTFACEKLFARPTILYFNNFDSIFSAVDKGLCRYGVLPVENSLHGSVTDVYDLMRKNHFYIVRSVKLKITHALLAKPGVRLNDIKAVYSHEQALAQCSQFLKDRNYEIQVYENTALAAKFVSESPRNDIAAIASMNCSELYGLDILDDSIQNSANNYTRFICISKKLEIFPGAKKISLVVTVPHRPGSLYHLMTKFSTLGVNLTKLESRPIPDRDFEFMFYFDLDVSVYDDVIAKLFSLLENGTDHFVFLGCYAEV